MLIGFYFHLRTSWSVSWSIFPPTLNHLFLFHLLLTVTSLTHSVSTCDMEPRDFHASHFTLLTKSSMPGLGVLQGPWVDWWRKRKRKSRRRGKYKTNTKENFVDLLKKYDTCFMMAIIQTLTAFWQHFLTLEHKNVNPTLCLTVWTQGRSAPEAIYRL